MTMHRFVFLKHWNETDLNDEFLTKWFIGINPNLLRHCPALGWFTWTGNVWQSASPQWAYDIISDFLKEYEGHLQYTVGQFHRDCDDDGCTESCDAATKLVKRYKSLYLNYRGIKNLREHLSAREGIRVEDPDMFDSHPHYLNCPNGVVDLRDGKLYAHSPSALMTRITGADYAPGATHRDVDKALEALDEMNDETRTWFQRFMGSGCSGDQPSDDLNLIQYGGGSNGKSTVNAAAMRALGSYASMVPNSVMSGSSDSAVGLAEFKGRRFMLCEETPEEGKLPTETIKQLSSGAPINARVMYKGPITFRATHTLLVATNHKPYVKETDKGTWRRLAMIPFNRVFEGADTTLRGRVESGKDGRAEAMLAWLVAGCIEWYANDRKLLPLPVEVAEFTQSWRDTNDIVGVFVRECVNFDPSGVLAKADLWSMFQAWCMDNSLAVPYRGQKGFNVAFSAHEFATTNRVTDGRHKSGMVWFGINLTAAYVPVM